MFFNICTFHKRFWLSPVCRQSAKSSQSRHFCVPVCLCRLDPRDRGGMEASPPSCAEPEHKASPPDVTKWELQWWAFPYQRGECGTAVSEGHGPGSGLVTAAGMWCDPWAVREIYQNLRYPEDCREEAEVISACRALACPLRRRLGNMGPHRFSEVDGTRDHLVPTPHNR